MDDLYISMTNVDSNEMDYFYADSCAISPLAFLLKPMPPLENNHNSLVTLQSGVKCTSTLRNYITDRLHKVVLQQFYYSLIIIYIVYP